MATWWGRAGQWTRTIAEFGLAQGFGQAAGMLAGLIYVRVMPVEQYALYALCLTALSVAAVGSDLGVTGALSYFWRKSLQDGSDIAPKVALVRRIRTVLFAGAMTIGITLVVTSTRAVPASGMAIAICLGIVALTAWINTRLGVDILLVRLKGQQRQSYIWESLGSAMRLAAAASMVVVGVGAAWFGLVGGLLGAVTTMALLRSASATGETTQATPTKEDWRQLRGYVLPLIPSVGLYMIQEPLVLWLAAVRGGAVPVAEVHALGRIAAILALVGSFVVVVLTPRLAAIADDTRFIRMSLLGLVPIVGILSAAILVGVFAPSLPLSLIGASYSHLKVEVAYAIASSSSNVLIAYVALTNRLKGRVHLEPYVAACQVLAMAACIAMWARYDTLGVLLLGLTLALTNLALFTASSVAYMLYPNLCKSE